MTPEHKELLKKLRSSVVSVGPSAMDMLEAFDSLRDEVDCGVGCEDRKPEHRCLKCLLIHMRKTDSVLDAARTELMLSGDYQLLTTQGLEREASLQRRLDQLREILGILNEPFCHWCGTNHTGERSAPDRFCPAPLLSSHGSWTEMKEDEAHE